MSQVPKAIHDQPKPTRRQMHCLVAALAALVTMLAACGGSTGADATDDEDTQVRVAVIPIAPVAPLYAGIEQGFFEAEGLDVEPVITDAGSPAVPAVLNGDFQFAFANTVSLLVAHEQGLPVKIVTQGVLGEADAEEAWSKLLVREDSHISEPADLEGATIAVNALSNIGDLTIMHAAEQAGVDPSTLKFLEIPFPDMLAALDEGRVDAIWAVEPFVTLGQQTTRSVLAPYSSATPNLTIATFFTAADYAEQNPDIVDRFTRAMNRSLEFAQDNPDEVRDIVPSFSEIPPEISRDMVLPVWRADLNLATIELTAELAARYGILEHEPELDKLLVEE